MAATKTNTQVLNAQSVSAGSGTTNSSAVDVSTAYDVAAHIKITNGASGPTIPGQVQIQLSADNSKWYNYGGALIGDTPNNAVRSWAIDIPRGTQYIRFAYGSNTGQAVTMDIDVSRITAI